MQGRLRKSGQEDRWSFCLRSTLSPSADDEARLKEAHDFSRAGLRCPHLPQFLDPPEVGRWDRPGAVFMGSRVACWTDGNTSSCQNNLASVECGDDCNPERCSDVYLHNRILCWDHYCGCKPTSGLSCEGGACLPSSWQLRRPSLNPRPKAAISLGVITTYRSSIHAPCRQ